MELMHGPVDVAKFDDTVKSTLLMTVAKALAFLHSKGVVHLDLKPANILMRAFRAKIADFGSVKLFDLSVTQISMALTMSYASPDALNGEDPDPSMDVYSFAVIAYEIATGTPAFDPKLPRAKLLFAILAGKMPEIPSSVTPVLRQVIEQGWAIDPRQRSTMRKICEKFASVGWCVFPDADAEKVAEAELELPIDAPPPATIALRVGKP
jgi:serine/threonine-protein kinase